MRNDLELETLCNDGFIILLVTGGAMELALERLTKWAYTRIDEIAWLKISNDYKLIPNGRTGHWLNHSRGTLSDGLQGGCPE